LSKRLAYMVCCGTSNSALQFSVGFSLDRPSRAPSALPGGFRRRRTRRRWRRRRGSCLPRGFANLRAKKQVVSLKMHTGLNTDRVSSDSNCGPGPMTANRAPQCHEAGPGPFVRVQPSSTTTIHRMTSSASCTQPRKWIPRTLATHGARILKRFMGTSFGSAQVCSGYGNFSIGFGRPQRQKG